jgi:hypothetical protein
VRTKPVSGLFDAGIKRPRNSAFGVDILPRMAKSTYSSPARGLSFKYAGPHGAVKGRLSLKTLLSGDPKKIKRAVKFYTKGRGKR